MTPLAPNLFDRRYDDLLEIGRSRLPSLAPAWTDYNAHDPGITLMELLAWVTEAQLYSLGRMRRDERAAYAALLGIVPAGTRAARGLLWPDPTDPASPATRFAGTRVIPDDAVVRLDQHDQPLFHPESKVLWVPGRIARLWTRLADGTERDLTRTNQRGTAFLPFGERGDPGVVLNLDFETGGNDGLFPAGRREADGARWPLGVRVADTAGDAGGATSCRHAGGVAVTLVVGRECLAVPVDDSTGGLLRTGVLALDLSGVAGSPTSFRLEIRAPHGFARPPRWLRIEPNVLPITQRTRVDRELHVATGRPDFFFDLNLPGLSFTRRLRAVRVEAAIDGWSEDWRLVDRLSDAGPEDRVYELDLARGRLSFGNGVNGRKPERETQFYVSYAVSDGVQGNVTGGKKWAVAGFPGVFGVNPDAVAGGADPTSWLDDRREARRRVQADHAFVSDADVVSGALALPLLDVARAGVVAPDDPPTGTLTLVAMRSRPGDLEPAEAPETPRWLEAVRRRLAGRMLLGTRLVVTAPGYVGFLVRARVEVVPGRKPADVESDVRRTLAKKLALVQSATVPVPRPFGVALARPEVAAWVLGVRGVARIASLELVQGRRVQDEIVVPRHGLPRLDIEHSTIEAVRPSARSDA